MTKKIIKIISFFIVAFCISQAGGWTSVFAFEGARTYMGFSGITAETAFPYEGGRARDTTQNTVNKQGRYAWGVYNFTATQTDISYFGVQYNQFAVDDDEAFGKWCGDLTGVPQQAGYDSFILYKTDGMDLNALDSDMFDQSSAYFSAEVGVTIFPFGGPLYFANSVMNDGTCRYHAISQTNGGTAYDPEDPTQPPFTIPAGHYLVMMNNQPGTNGFIGSGGEDYYYTLNGDYTHGYTQRMLVGFTGGVAVNYNSGTPDEWRMLTADVNDGGPDNLNWYLGKTDTEIVPGDTETVSCNPFINDISTVFLNPSFSFLGCVKSAFTWAFIPTEESMNQFSTLTLSNSEPFSYVYDIGNAYDELFSNTGSMEYAVSADTDALGTINFISASQISAIPYSSTIKTILGYLLWFFTGMFIYRILLRVHD